MSERSLEQKDIIKMWLPLAVIDMAGEVKGSTRLQKLVFLGEVEGRVGECFEFELNNYGPYSSDLAQQISFYTTARFVTESQFQLSAEYGGNKRSDYQLTDEGRRIIAGFEKSKNIRELRPRLLKVIEKWMDVPLNTLLEYVYQEYLAEGEELEGKIKLFYSSYDQVWQDWTEREQSHYPVSWNVMAWMEHARTIVDRKMKIDDDLQRQVIVNAACDFIKTSMDLQQVYDKYRLGAPDEDEDRILQTVWSKLLDIFRFLDGYASSKGVTEKFSELMIEDVTDEKERRKIKKELKQLL